MNNSRRAGEHRVDSYKAAKGSLNPWETDPSRSIGYPVFEVKSGPTSPSSAPDIISSYHTPNTLEATGGDRPMSYRRPKHRGCAYTLNSWVPELLCCFLGILAMAGKRHTSLLIIHKLTI
jgi:hypothetical protein